MKEIKINKTDYEPFRDYNDFMVKAFGIGCSLCGSQEISFVLKGHPETMGNVVKDIQGKDDALIEKKLDDMIDQWQKFDDHNADENRPTYLCDECWNSFEE